MLGTTAYLKTENASKYLVQLCKHFAHKIEVSYSDIRGECRFDGGVGILDAEENGLRMTVNAEDENRLEWARGAIESHLVRFAFRETIDALEWKRQDEVA